jgi:hypothetical protein
VRRGRDDGMSLGEAKRVVHLSPAWADRREQDDPLHEALSRRVAAAQHRDMPDGYWALLASAAETLCLNELLDLLVAERIPTNDDWDHVQAARVVRSRTRSAR